jgi:hypothetical protein
MVWWNSVRQKPRVPVRGQGSFAIAAWTFTELLVAIYVHRVNAAEIDQVAGKEYIGELDGSEQKPAALSEFYPHRPHWVGWPIENPRLARQQIYTRFDEGDRARRVGNDWNLIVLISRERSVEVVLRRLHDDPNVRRGRLPDILDPRMNAVFRLITKLPLDIDAAARDLDFVDTKIGLQLPSFLVSGEAELEQGNARIGSEENEAENLQEHLRSLAPWAFSAVSLLCATGGVVLLRRGRAVGVALVVMTFPFVYLTLVTLFRSGGF